MQVFSDLERSVCRMIHHQVTFSVVKFCYITCCTIIKLTSSTFLYSGVTWICVLEGLEFFMAMKETFCIMERKFCGICGQFTMSVRVIINLGNIFAA